MAHLATHFSHIYTTPSFSVHLNMVFVKYLHFMCYNVHVRERNVGANSLNVVSRNFPHFSLKSILTPMVMSHNLVVETRFYDTI